MRTILAAAALAAFGLSGCSTAAQRDINAILGSSVASTAVSYVAALDPTLVKYLDNADAAIAAEAPKVLKYACGAVSMGNLIVGTVHTVDPKLIDDATYQLIETAVAAVQAPCTNPPQNIADAAHQALGVYGEIFQAIKGAGVALPKAA
jgi:hypothetical protein